MAKSGWDTDDLSQYEDITTFGLPPITSPTFQKALGENLAFSTLTPVEFLGEFGIEGGIQGWIDQGLLFLITCMKHQKTNLHCIQ